MRCPSCSTEIRDKEASCPSCGALVVPSSIVSIHGAASEAPVQRPPSSHAGPKARFQPGELVSGRYRIVARLGRGGMGEVYRADDLVLDQPVALKSLRAEIGADPAARARFLSEVKLARAVSHPNVCRVHDVGELDGLLYLSMEYVDGEDLAALLRRIGAPGEKKALEIAEQLCAGMAAAHARGVLHRDLKPANVMIDGAGKVRITDFGLAILEKDESGRRLLAGTPAYMAPEQLTGGEATAKSDVYALGLVLHELFTGVRVWTADDVGQLRTQHATRHIELPRAHALDERIERTILSCLERDPARRPHSPTSVAAGLTGADPLAAVLAAGETPTPEMVAASGGEGTIGATVAYAALAAIVLLFFGVVFLASRASLHDHIALAKEPAVLADNAHEILRSVGLAIPEADRVFGFETTRVERPDAQFWYREAPFSLQVSPFDSRVSPDDPPLHWPGMVLLRLSTRGKLEGLEAVPPRVTEPNTRVAHCDWAPLFAAAGLALADFTPTDASAFTPPQTWDERAAWKGVDRVVCAASLRGRPVFFALLPWAESSARPFPAAGSRDASRHVKFWCYLLSLVGGIALARRNWIRGSGDRRAALRLAVVVALLDLSEGLLRANHSTDMFMERWLIIEGLATALFSGANAWLIYLALEPYVRRIWPDHLVSWGRLFAGRWRDPLVARDLLAGLGTGILLSGASFAQVWIGMSQGAPGATYVTRNFPATTGLRATLREFFFATGDGIAGSLIFLFVLVALRALVRRTWIVYLVVLPLISFANAHTNPTGLPVLDWAYSLCFAGLILWLLGRLGVLALAVGLATYDLVNVIPLTSDLSAWYAGPTILAGLMVCGLALAAAHFASGRRALAA